MGQTHQLGRQAELEILQFLNRMAGQVSPTHSSEFLQALWGDYTILKNNEPYAIELKAEHQNAYGNFFLETWSNRSWRTLGWIYKLRGDSLFYYFVQDKELWTIKIPSLLDWCFGVGDEQGHIWLYRERKQSKHDQKNDSWGRPVPIVRLQKDLGDDIKLFKL